MLGAAVRRVAPCAPRNPACRLPRPSPPARPVMPSKYTLDSLPVPTNSAVELREEPARLAAALEFRGHIRGRATVDRKRWASLAAGKGGGGAERACVQA